MNDLLISNADADLFTSVITVAEYFPYPLQQPNCEELLREFNEFIQQAEIAVINIDREIAMEAARIRAEYKTFKMMDSLQLSAASVCGCSLFLTNDKQLRQFRRFPCLTLEEL